MEEKTNKNLNLYSICIILGTLAITNLTLDQTLTIKLFFFSLALTAFVYYSKQKISINIDFINITYLLVILIQLSSILYAQNKEEAIFGNVKNIFGYLIFIISINLISTNKHNYIKTIKKSVIFISLFTFASIIYQLTAVNYDNIYNLTGVHGHKNLISSFLIIIIGVLLIDYKLQTKKSKIFTLIVLTLNLISIFILQSRAVWLGLFIAGIITSLVNYTYIKVCIMDKLITQKNKNLISVVSSLFVALMLIYPLRKIILWCEKNFNKLSFLKHEDLERIVLWNKTYQIFQKNPIFGVGTNNWQIHFPNESLKGIWRAEDLNVTFQRPHNDILWILSENGMITLFLIITLTLSILIMIFLCKNKSEKLNNYLFFFVSLAFIISSFFDFPKERIEHIFWWNTWLALIYTKNNSTINKINVSEKIMLLILSIVLILSSIRLNSEINQKKMVYEIKKNCSKKIIKRGVESKSIIYSIDNFSYPIDWFIAKAYIEQNELKKGLIHLNYAYKLAPYNRYVINDLGVINYKLKKEIKAIKFFKESIRISPRFNLPKFNLCSIYLKNNEFKKARKIERLITNESKKRDLLRKKL